MTGLWCPLCGSTRASSALVHAQPVTALHANALFVAALPVLAVLWWRRVAPAERKPLPRPVGWAAIAVVVAFGVYRNLPQGRWLAPPS